MTPLPVCTSYLPLPYVLHLAYPSTGIPNRKVNFNAFRVIELTRFSTVAPQTHLQAAPQPQVPVPSASLPVPRGLSFSLLFLPRCGFR